MGFFDKKKKQDEWDKRYSEDTVSEAFIDASYKSEQNAAKKKKLGWHLDKDEKEKIERDDAVLKETGTYINPDTGNSARSSSVSICFHCGQAYMSIYDQCSHCGYPRGQAHTER